MNWLRDHIHYPHDQYCLIWPFARLNGYGVFICDGKKSFVGRYICELKNGPPPTPEHQAAHSCNRGRFGCANHHHLRWKTQSENILEGDDRSPLKLTLEQAMEIRSSKGLESNQAIADRFGITECTVRDIQDGRTWKDGGRRKRLFRDAEVQRIRAMKGVRTAKMLAAEYGVKPNVIYKIWLRLLWVNVPEIEVSFPSE